MKKKMLIEKVEAYVKECLENDRLPNQAGFLRYSRMTKTAYLAECAKNPQASELIEAVFEDEALNAGSKKIPAAVLNMYLKSRFGYGEREEQELELISEHSESDGE